MYDKEYADIWIEYARTGEDQVRKENIHPFVKKNVNKMGRGQSLLDVGCGWGIALDYLPQGCHYYGIDPTPEFLRFIRKKYDYKMTNLRNGKLPNNIPFPDNFFDTVLCSMALHCTRDLKNSIATLFSKAKSKGRVVIAGFRDDAEHHLRKGFIRMDVEKEDYVRGLYNLSDKAEIVGEAWLHKEKRTEELLARHASSTEKTYLGPFFVGYECEKQ